MSVPPYPPFACETRHVAWRLGAMPVEFVLGRLATTELLVDEQVSFDVEAARHACERGEPVTLTNRPGGDWRESPKDPATRHAVDHDRARVPVRRGHHVSDHLALDLMSFA